MDLNGIAVPIAVGGVLMVIVRDNHTDVKIVLVIEGLDLSAMILWPFPLVALVISVSLWVSTSACLSHSQTDLATYFGPLSLRICCGVPRTANKYCSTGVMYVADSNTTGTVRLCRNTDHIEFALFAPEYNGINMRIKPKAVMRQDAQTLRQQDRSRGQCR